MEYSELIEDIIYYLEKTSWYEEVTAEENEYDISFFLEAGGDEVSSIIKKMEYMILDSGHKFHEIELVDQKISFRYEDFYEYEFVLIKNRY
tara:strand:- start:18 stop:290 length:273 start_codon:yes stop_codon:yes gene_type:complete